MDTIGKRIARQRLLLGYSRPELARRVSDVINKQPPLSGEAIRRYEIGKNSPGKDVRRGLAAVLNKSEVYIEFGDSPPAKGNSDADALWNAYLKAPSHERIIIDALLKRYIKKG